MEKINRQMAALTRPRQSKAASLPKELQNMLNDAVVFKYGAFILRSLYTDAVEATLSARSYLDLSGYEYSQNKIHLEDYFGSNDVFGRSLEFFDQISRLLSQDFESQSFILVLSFQPDSEFGNLASFSFYGERTGQSVIDVESLDDYAQPILVRTLRGIS